MTESTQGTALRKIEKSETPGAPPIVRDVQIELEPVSVELLSEKLSMFGVDLSKLDEMVPSGFDFTGRDLLR